MKQYCIGLLSGTSVDGIDAAIVEFSEDSIKMVCNHEQAFTGSLKSNLQKIIQSQSVSLSQLSDVDSLLAFEFSQAVDILITKSGIDKSKILAIGSHGQTIFHQPNGNHTNTIQIGSAHKIAAMTGINVVSNFRNLDMAYGGQGAPLAPLIHEKLFARKNKNTAVINLGGIANISFVGQDFTDVIGYDVGPANCLIDEWITIHKQLPYDDNGQWGRQGVLSQELLTQMLNDAYFTKQAPKSTGREYFNHKWYDQFQQLFKTTSAIDIQATLTHLVAASIKAAIQERTIHQIIVMGGGANNGFLTQLIGDYCQIETVKSDQFGYDANWVESILFAYLAHQRVNENKLSLGSFTGSSKKILVGDLVCVV